MKEFLYDDTDNTTDNKKGVNSPECEVVNRSENRSANNNLFPLGSLPILFLI